MTAQHTLEGAASEVLPVLSLEDPDLACLLSAKTQRCLKSLEEPTSPIGTAFSLAVLTLDLGLQIHSAGTQVAREEGERVKGMKAALCGWASGAGSRRVLMAAAAAGPDSRLCCPTPSSAPCEV